MWCSTCQQDVPALGSASEGTLRCGKCNGALASASGATHDMGGRNSRRTASSSTTANFPPLSNSNATLEKLLRATPLSNEDWAIEAELRGVQRLLTSLKTKPATVPDTSNYRNPTLTTAGRNNSDAVRPTTPQPRRSTESPQSRGHALAWTILSIGLAVFACGAVLLGWSLVGKRDDLWPVGMPLTLIGQAGLILGLVLQLDGLWSSNRQTAEVLSELDEELKTVREATALLSTTQSSGAQSFYLHLAEGASPSILLADLKGQMDLLAQQMARYNRP